MFQRARPRPKPRERGRGLARLVRSALLPPRLAPVEPGRGRHARRREAVALGGLRLRSPPRLGAGIQHPNGGPGLAFAPTIATAASDGSERSPVDSRSPAREGGVTAAPSRDASRKLRVASASRHRERCAFTVAERRSISIPYGSGQPRPAPQRTGRHRGAGRRIDAASAFARNGPRGGETRSTSARSRRGMLPSIPG
jgi:hypothetical protein